MSFREFEELKKHAITVTTVEWGPGAKSVGGRSITKQVLLVKRQDIGQQQVGSQQKQTWPEGNRQAARNQKNLQGSESLHRQALDTGNKAAKKAI